MASRKDSTTPIARRVESGYTNYHMSSGGSGLSRPKPQGRLHFFLVYGSEAILPADIMWKSPRVEMYNEGEADEARQLELDSIEEARCTALVQSAQYLQGIRRYHDRNIRERSFSTGDLVLRRIQDESGLHKLNSRWEGPFIIKQVTRPGSYRLQYPDG
jgi:hypothetical protein